MSATTKKKYMYCKWSLTGHFAKLVYCSPYYTKEFKS